ncbi:PhzF family phenazine biosynthesis protein [Deinococcus maricopensis]|uniref:Phenazine biosynthesis PhzC/PhzF protein n=1 Tax=Deinococcus maricopensis (strain DSM 21211 / LMG 22137 / NRRL B-23946 / LB-34) TaxID=709986 RepID=E8U7G8_DEIML|nr:PhzF family phenazine biosynthesis protein [Deinococcus maricopensis]ADV67007.1 Phenazine biosynthesis PhzC/PhzF protein [Deinococcus maricopensis DSM 21211]
MNVAHYRALTLNGQGGKPIAVALTPGWEEDALRDLAALTGAPLLACVTDLTGDTARVRYFKGRAEKPDSDSGALAVTAHLARIGAYRGGLRVQSPGGIMRVGGNEHGGLIPQLGAPDDALGHEAPLADEDLHALLSALNLRATDLVGPPAQCGTATKRNAVLPLAGVADVAALQPQPDALAEVQTRAGLSGVIPCTFNAPGRDVDYRFFAPARGLPEDRAGCFTFATLCAYMAHRHYGEGARTLTGTQASGSDAPGGLRAEVYLRDRSFTVATGGAVTPLTSGMNPTHAHEVRA